MYVINWLVWCICILIGCCWCISLFAWSVLVCVLAWLIVTGVFRCLTGTLSVASYRIVLVWHGWWWSVDVSVDVSRAGEGGVRRDTRCGQEPPVPSYWSPLLGRGGGGWWSTVNRLTAAEPSPLWAGSGYAYTRTHTYTHTYTRSCCCSCNHTYTRSCCCTCNHIYNQTCTDSFSVTTTTTTLKPAISVAILTTLTNTSYRQSLDSWFLSSYITC